MDILLHFKEKQANKNRNNRFQMGNKSSTLSQDPHSDIPIYLYDENESILTINENVGECYDKKDKCSYPWE